jgi:SnoaL-like protein
MSEEVLQRLLDRELIEGLKARYFWTVDTRDWDGFRAVFADDVHVFDEPLGRVIEGADAFVEVARGLIESTDARTVHHGHTPEITVDSPSEAHGTWELVDYVEWPPDPDTGERRGLRGYGRYEETYRKVDGEWKIAGMRVTYRRMEPLLPQPLPAEIVGGPEIVNEGAR